MPTKPTRLLATLCLTLYGILSFCGNLHPVMLFASMQLIAFLLLLVLYRHTLKQTLGQLWQQQKTNSLLSLAWLVCVGAAAIHSLMIHSNPNQHLAIGFRIIYNLLQISFFIVLLSASRLDTKFYEKAFGAFIVGFLVLATIQIHALWGTQKPDAFEWLKYPLFNANIRESGMLAACCTMICSIYALTSQKKIQQTLAFAIATFSLSYLFWTGGRMGVIATLTSLIIFAVAIFIKHRRWLPPLILCLVCIPIALVIAEHFALFSWNSLGHLSGHEQSEYFKNPSSGRLEIWQYTFQAIKNYPLLGNGPFSFYFLEARKASGFLYDHPHSMPLQFLLEWGIIGSLFIAALLLNIYYQGWRLFFSQQQPSIPTIIALGLITMFSLHSLTSATYWSLQPVVILLLAYSCLVTKVLVSKPLPSKISG